MSTHLRVLAVLDHSLQTFLLRGDTALRAARGVVLGLARCVGRDAIDDPVALLARVEEDAGRGFAVAAGAPGFLDELF